MAEPLPAEGFWQKGINSEPPKDGVDRIFLVNRGWAHGRVTKVDEKNVSFEAGGQTQTFTRPEVSLIQLTDWLSSKKRLDTQEVKVRLECEGEAECAIISFTRGTIIAKVDSAPYFTKGKDDDDKVESDRTTIRFEKGDKDRSITTLAAELTLLVPGSDFLNCEVQCQRANGYSGPLTIRFLNPVDGKELVSTKRPADFWSRIDVPLARLKPRSPPIKIDCLPVAEAIMPRVKSLPRPQAPASPKENTEARVILSDYAMGSGRVIGMDEETLRLQVGISKQPIVIPRWKIATIELNDWESVYRNVKIGAQADAELTPPLTVTF